MWIDILIFILGVALISYIMIMHIQMIWNNVKIYKLLGSPESLENLPTQENLINIFSELNKKSTYDEEDQDMKGYV